MKRTLAILLVAPILATAACSSTGGSKRGTSASRSGRSVRNPLYPFTLMREGSVQLQQGHYEQALKSFQEAAVLQPGNATAYNMIGRCYLNLHQPDKALEALNKALAIIPSFSDARNNRGVTYLTLKQYRLAEVDFLAVLSDTTYPHRWDVYYNLGLTYLERNQLVAAEENFKRATTAPSPVFQAFLRLAEVEQRLGKPEEAVTTLETAHLRFPDRPEATLQLAKALILVGRKEDARGYLESLVKDAPDSSAAREARRLLQEK